MTFNHTPVSGISVVIPCYRSADSLPQLIERLEPVLREVASEFEVLLICDRCPEGTWEVIQELCEAKSFVRGAEMARNVGQQIAVMAGLKMVQYEYTVTIDDDLQHAPSEITGMLNQLLEEDLDGVIANLRDKKHGLIRNFGSLVTRRMMKSALGMKKPLKFSSYRVFRSWVGKAAAAMNMPQPVVGFALLTVTDRIANYEIEHGVRGDGKKSTYSLTHLVKYFTSIAFSYSVLPMRIISWVGIGGAVLAMMIAVLYLVLALAGLTGGNGFTTIIVVLGTFFSLLLASIGVLGQYVIFLIKVAGGDKLYYIRNSTNGSHESEQKTEVRKT